MSRHLLLSENLRPEIFSRKKPFFLPKRPLPDVARPESSSCLRQNPVPPIASLTPNAAHSPGVLTLAVSRSSPQPVHKPFRRKSPRARRSPQDAPLSPNSRPLACRPEPLPPPESSPLHLHQKSRPGPRPISAATPQCPPSKSFLFLLMFCESYINSSPTNDKNNAHSSPVCPASETRQTDCPPDFSRHSAPQRRSLPGAHLVMKKPSPSICYLSPLAFTLP